MGVSYFVRNSKEAMREKLFTVSIKDCRVDTFRSGGKGGQNQNKRDSGVRVVHEPSGAVGESREERSQFQNKKNAFVKMANSKLFQDWAKRTAAKLQGEETIEERVDRMMHPSNLLTETFNGKEWETVNDPLT